MAALLNSVRAFFTPQTFHVDQENPGDVVARENLLDRAMGAGRRRKSSEKLRAGRIPAEGLALVARDENGHVIGTVRLWNVEAGSPAKVAPSKPCCSARSPSMPPMKARASDRR